MRVLLTIFASLLLAVCLSAAFIETDRARLDSFLTKYIGLNQMELDAVHQDKPVAKALATKEKREVALFGIVHVCVPRSHFLWRYRDIVTFKRSSVVAEIGKFSDPPKLEDLATLTLEPEDLKAMRDCRVGDCSVKLPISVIDRLRREINWSAPGSQEKALALAKESLLHYVQSYLKGGNPALIEYHDHKDALRLSDEFRSVLQASNYLYDYMPEFHQYLDEFPVRNLANTESFIYWTKEKFGLKPVVSLTHSVIYRENRSGQDRIIIAAKQLYSSHYFEASVALAALLDDTRDTNKPAFYLLYLNRARADALRGGFSGLKRSIIESKTREALLETLRAGKEVLETEYRMSSPARTQ